LPVSWRRFVRWLFQGVEATLEELECKRTAFVMGSIPLLLLSIGVIEGSQSWALDPTVESIFVSRSVIWSAFASNYVHLSVRHLSSNILTYWVLLVGIYPLVVLSGRERQALRIAVLLLLVVPFFVSHSTVLLYDVSRPAAGFSGILGAALGFLPFAWFDTLEEGAGRNISLRFQAIPLMLSFSLVLAVFSMRSGTDSLLMLSAVFGIVSVICGVLFLFSSGQRILAVFQSAYGPPLVSGAVVFAIATGGLFVVFDTNVNVIGHFTGFLLGSLFSIGIQINDRYEDLV
jgi:hypothetical protein